MHLGRGDRVKDVRGRNGCILHSEGVRERGREGVGERGGRRERKVM